MILEFHHVAVSVPDLDKAVDFYCNILGFEEMMRDSWADSEFDDVMCDLKGVSGRYALVRLGQVALEILEYWSPHPSPRPVGQRICDEGLTHLCLRVDDAQAEYLRLGAAGMTFLSPPVPNGGRDGISAGWCAYGRDPFGNFIEILQLADEAPPEGRGS